MSETFFQFSNFDSISNNWPLRSALLFIPGLKEGFDLRSDLRSSGIEPESSAWKAPILPLNYERRVGAGDIISTFQILKRGLTGSWTQASGVIDWRDMACLVKEIRIPRRKPLDYKTRAIIKMTKSSQPGNRTRANRVLLHWSVSADWEATILPLDELGRNSICSLRSNGLWVPSLRLWAHRSSAELRCFHTKFLKNPTPFLHTVHQHQITDIGNRTRTNAGRPL